MNEIHTSSVEPPVSKDAILVINRTDNLHWYIPVTDKGEYDQGLFSSILQFCLVG